MHEIAENMQRQKYSETDLGMATSCDGDVQGHII